MVKKYILGIVTIIVFVALITFLCVSTVQARKENLINAIENNDLKISQIEIAQVKLHETAEALRQLQIDDTDFIDSLSSKWLELNEEKHILIQDNTNYQQKLNEMVRQEKNVVKPVVKMEDNTSDVNNDKTYVGDFTLLAYYQGTVTATGTRPQTGHTIAVDPSVIPYGSSVYIEGYGTYVAEDCGGGIKGNMIDIYMSSYDECIQFGRRKAKVYIIN